MACQLDMANIRRVVLGVYIVVLQDTRCIEVIDEAAVLKMFVHLLGFFLVDLCRLVCHALLDKRAPLRLWKIEDQH